MSGLLRIARAAALLIPVLALLSPAGLAAQAAPAPAAPADIEKVKQAVTDLRMTGTAIWAWYKDEMLPKRKPGLAMGGGTGDTAPKTVKMDEVPVIPASELKKLLVPVYAQDIPEVDPWGKPYEYRLNTGNPDAVRMMSLRTAGADGQFSGDEYPVGSYLPTEAQNDMVWIDGYFVRWPGYDS
jgi:hypothetical protein